MKLPNSSTDHLAVITSLKTNNKVDKSKFKSKITFLSPSNAQLFWTFKEEITIVQQNMTIKIRIYLPIKFIQRLESGVYETSGF